MTTAEQTAEVSPRRGGHILVGLVLILLGLGFLAERMSWWHVELSSHFWPLIPLFFGVVRLIAPGTRNGCPRSRRGAIWLLSIGIWGLVSEFEIFGMDYSTSWPLLIVAVGLNMVWRAFEAPAPRRTRES